MKKILLLTLCLLYPNIACAYNFNNVEFISNWDGDTITVNINDIHPMFGKKAKIRLSKINTAEINYKSKCEQYLSIKAKEYVNHVLSDAEQINLINCKKGRYFRMVCDVIYDNNNLSNELLKLKYAYKYNGGKKKKIDWCNF